MRNIEHEERESRRNPNENPAFSREARRKPKTRPSPPQKPKAEIPKHKNNPPPPQKGLKLTSTHNTLPRKNLDRLPLYISHPKFCCLLLDRSLVHLEPGGDLALLVCPSIAEVGELEAGLEDWLKSYVTGQ